MNELQSGLFAQQVRERLEAAGVFWLYKGKPRKDAPHALLTSGSHSNGYVNVGQVLKEQPETRKVFAEYILAVLHQAGYKKSFDRVVGADTSSTDLARDIATIAKVDYIRMLKTEYSKDKRQVWHSSNIQLRERKSILHIEELITTSFSALQVREGIRRANPGKEINFVPFLPVVVERSNPDDRIIVVEDSKILPLLRLCIRNYEPNDCPYCAIGSMAIKPKQGDNWLKLTT